MKGKKSEGKTPHSADSKLMYATTGSLSGTLCALDILMTNQHVCKFITRE